MIASSYIEESMQYD